MVGWIVSWQKIILSEKQQGLGRDQFAQIAHMREWMFHKNNEALSFTKLAGGRLIMSQGRIMMMDQYLFVEGAV